MDKSINDKSDRRRTSDTSKKSDFIWINPDISPSTNEVTGKSPRKPAQGAGNRNMKPVPVLKASGNGARQPPKSGAPVQSKRTDVVSQAGRGRPEGESRKKVRPSLPCVAGKRPPDISVSKEEQEKITQLVAALNKALPLPPMYHKKNRSAPMTSPPEWIAPECGMSKGRKPMSRENSKFKVVKKSPSAPVFESCRIPVAPKNLVINKCENAIRERVRSKRQHGLKKRKAQSLLAKGMAEKRSQESGNRDAKREMEKHEPEIALVPTGLEKEPDYDEELNSSDEEFIAEKKRRSRLCPLDRNLEDEIRDIEIRREHERQHRRDAEGWIGESNILPAPTRTVTPFYVTMVSTLKRVLYILSFVYGAAALRIAFLRRRRIALVILTLLFEKKIPMSRLLAMICLPFEILSVGGPIFATSVFGCYFTYVFGKLISRFQDFLPGTVQTSHYRIKFVGPDDSVRGDLDRDERPDALALMSVTHVDCLPYRVKMQEFALVRRIRWPWHVCHNCACHRFRATRRIQGREKCQCPVTIDTEAVEVSSEEVTVSMELYFQLARAGGAPLGTQTYDDLVTSLDQQARRIHTINYPRTHAARVNLIVNTVAMAARLIHGRRQDLIERINANNRVLDLDGQPSERKPPDPKNST